jgi:hypothetical protein
MSDRELLELAAKAAGIKLRRWNATHACYEPDGYSNIAPIGLWNPILNDGDALRLAVKLSMDTDDGLSIHLADSEDRNTVVSKSKVYVREDVDSDPYAATRRAIVRAAAEIGKAMP